MQDGENGSQGDKVESVSVRQVRDGESRLGVYLGNTVDGIDYELDGESKGEENQVILRSVHSQMPSL